MDAEGVDTDYDSQIDAVAAADATGGAVENADEAAVAAEMMADERV